MHIITITYIINIYLAKRPEKKSFKYNLKLKIIKQNVKNTEIPNVIQKSSMKIQIHTNW